LYERSRNIGMNADEQLRSILFMVGNAPASASEATVMLANCRKQVGTAMMLMQGALQKLGKPVPDMGNEVPADLLQGEEAKRNEVIDAVETELAAVRKLAVALYGPASGDAPPGEPVVRLDGIEERWNQIKETAILPADLGGDSYLRQIAAARTEIEKKLSAKAQGTYGPADLAFEQQIVLYRQASEALHTKAAEALSVNSDIAIDKGLSTAPSMLDTRAETLIDQHTKKRGSDEDVGKRTAALIKVREEIEALSVQAGKVAQLSDSSRKEIMSECQILMGYCTGTINNAALRLGDKGARTATGLRSKEREAALQYAEALRDELSRIVAPRQSNDGAVLRDMRTNLIAFRDKADAFNRLCQPGDNKVVFSAVSKEALKLRARFDHSLLLPRAEALKPLRDEVETIAANYTKMDPERAMQTLAGLKLRIDEAQNAAKQEHDAAEKFLVDVRNKLGGFSLGLLLDSSGIGGGSSGFTAEYSKYAEDISRRSSDLTEAVRAGDKASPEHQKTLDGLVKEIQAFTSKDATACAKGEQGVEAVEKQMGEAQERLTTLRKADLAALKDTAGDLPSVARRELLKQIQEIDDAISSAIKNLLKTRDVEAASGMADAVQRRIERLREAPMGTATSKRNQLPAAEQRWADAVGTMHSALDALPDKIRAIVKDETDLTLKSAVESAAEALGGKLGEVKGLFRKDSFGTPIKRMTAGGAAPEEISAAREDGLREARRIGKFMAAHPTLRQLAAMPKKFEADLPLPMIATALFNMETNLTISG
jgi:hypothetical protein